MGRNLRMSWQTWLSFIGSCTTSLALASMAAAQMPLADHPSASPWAQTAPLGQSAPAAQSAPSGQAAPAGGMENQQCPSAVAQDGDFSLCEVIYYSIFTKQAPKRDWTPLYAYNFFTEGWLQPRIDPPNGSGGSLRQGWIGVPDAFFNRQIIFGMYTYAQGAHGAQNSQSASFLVESPISQRWDVGIIVPYVDEVFGDNRPSEASFGDVVIENRFLVHETKDLTVSFNFNIETPTGDTRTSNGQTVLIPYFAFYKDLGFAGWSVRGAAGLDEPVSGPAADRFTTFFQSIGVGETLTPHDVPIFGDFTPNVCFEASQSVDNNTNAFFSVTAGFRTHLGNDYFLLFGATIPLSANAGFHEEFTVFVLKGF
jgi:hypothetical protein